MLGRSAALMLAALAVEDEVPLQLLDVPDLRGVRLPVRIDLEALAPGRDPGRVQLYRVGRDGGHLAVPAQLSADDGRLVFLHACDGETGRFRLGDAEVIATGRRPLWSLAETPEGRLMARWRGRDVLGYCHRDQLAEGLDPRWARSSYVYPLYGPAGLPVLEDFPEDHYHHRGISWMWPRVLVGDERRSYDLWTLAGIRNQFHGFDQQVTGRVFARIGVRNRWMAQDDVVVHETVRVTVYPPEPDSSGAALAGTTLVDFDLGWRAGDEEVALAGQTTGGKGYGGFLVRLADSSEVQLHSPRGTEPEELLHQRFGWTALSGKLAGTDQVVTLAILAHPDNPGHPSEWLMRFQGYVGHSWPGLEPVSIPRGEELRLRFRVVVIPGRTGVSRLARLAEAWVRPPRLVRES